MTTLDDIANELHKLLPSISKKLVEPDAKVEWIFIRDAAENLITICENASLTLQDKAQFDLSSALASIYQKDSIDTLGQALFKLNHDVQTHGLVQLTEDQAQVLLQQLGR